MKMPRPLGSVGMSVLALALTGALAISHLSARTAHAQPTSAAQALGLGAPSAVLPPFGPVIGNSIGFIVKELRRCIGPISPEMAREWQGARWLCNPEEIPHAIAREVLAQVAGTGPNSATRGQNNPVDAWRRLGVSEEETNLSKLAAFNSFYTVLGNPVSETAGTVVTPETNDGLLRDWNDFRQLIRPSKNPWGRLTEIGILTASMENFLQRSLAALAQPGDPYPEFEGERDDAQFGASAVATGDGQTAGLSTSRVARSASWNKNIQTLLAESPKTLAEASKDPLVPVSVSSPDSPQVNPLLGALGQAAVQATAFGDRLTGAAAGRSVELTGLGAPSAALPAALVREDLLRSLSQRIATDVQQRLGGLGNALNFLGPAAGGVSDILGTDNFGSLASAFGGGGGGGSGGGGGGGLPGSGGSPSRLEDVPTDQRPPASDCANRTPQITEEEARGIAALKGLTLPSDPGSPWTTQYVPASSTYGVRAVEPSSGVLLTVGPDFFPDASACLWVVSVAAPNGGTNAILIEDIRTPPPVTLHLNIRV